VKIVKNERDPRLFTSKKLIKVIVRHRICLQTDRQTDGWTDGHGETSIPPYNFVVGGITTDSWYINHIKVKGKECIDVTTVKCNVIKAEVSIYLHHNW
jgi:hypothetical protein